MYYSAQFSGNSVFNNLYFTLDANHQLTLPQNVKSSATQEFHFAFVMTCAMASEMTMNRDTTKNEYTVQVNTLNETVEF